MAIPYLPPQHRFKVTVLILIICAITGSVSVLPIVPLVFVARSLFRNGRTANGVVLMKIVNETGANIMGRFFRICGTLLRVVCGIETEIVAVLPGKHARDVATSTGLADVLRKPPTGKTTILMCNHRTRVDWMLLWLIFNELPELQYVLKIVLKDELARLPFFGWAMQAFRFLFLSRNWAKDERRIRGMAHYYKCFDDTTILLIFPEGTDHHPDAIKKSVAFAEQNGLPVPTHVLVPRSSGLHAVMVGLGDRLHEVVDLTFGYEDFTVGERPSEKLYWAGRISRKINVLVQVFRFTAPSSSSSATRTPGQDDPKSVFRVNGVDVTNKVALGQWVQSRFERKDEVLKHYYDAPRPTPERDTTSNRLVFSWMHVAYRMRIAAEADNFPTGPEGWVRLKPPLPDFMNVVVNPLLWAVGSLFICRFLFTSATGFLFFITWCAGMVLTSRLGGIDQLLLYPTALLAAPLPPVPAGDAGETKRKCD